MNLNQPSVHNTQMPSAYRQNYHINPAQSKIVYKSAQNMQYVMLNDNKINSNQVGNVQSMGRQINPHYMNQVNQPQQIRSFPPSPHIVQTQAYMNTRSVIPQNQIKVNQNNQMIYSFQQGSPQHQRQQSYHYSAQRPGNMNALYSAVGPNGQIVPNSQQNMMMVANNMIQRSNMPQMQQFSSGGMNAVNFNIPKQQQPWNMPPSNQSALTFSVPNPQQINTYGAYQQQMPQKSVVHGPNQVMKNMNHTNQSITRMDQTNSPINISLSGVSPTSNMNPVTLNGTQNNYHHPQIHSNRVQTYPLQAQQTQQTKQQNLFHLTKSMEYDIQGLSNNIIPVHAMANVQTIPGVQIIREAQTLQETQYIQSTQISIQQASGSTYIQRIPNFQQGDNNQEGENTLNRIHQTKQNQHQNQRQNQLQHQGQLQHQIPVQQQISVQHEIPVQHQVQIQDQIEYQDQVQDQVQNQQQNLPNPIWEQRFIMIYQKFEWFYERYDFISRQFTILSQQFQNVNSQDEWLQLKQKHDLLLQKIQQIQQQLINTINENQQLAQQYQLQNRNQKEQGESDKVWQHRYHQLLEQYKSLSQNYADLQSQGNNHMTASQNKGGLSLDQQGQLQGRFQQLQNEYNVLCQQYQKIRIQYQRTYEENTQYSKQNGELVASHQQARNMTSQLQAYVQQLQHQNDQLRKQERKSTNSQNAIPRQEVEKMQYQFGQEIQKYEEELQKYRMAFDQYEEQTQLNRQQLEKVSEIAMQRENRIKQLELTTISNIANSRGNQSNKGFSGQQSVALEKNYISQLQHEIQQLRKQQLQLRHQLQIKDFERRNKDQKIQFLQRQYEKGKQQIERISINFDEKLVKIQQNTSNNSNLRLRDTNKQQLLKSAHSQCEGQIHDLQAQLHDLQAQLAELHAAFNAKARAYKQLQQSIQTCESQLKKQANDQNMSSIQFHKKTAQIQIQFNRKTAQKQMRIAVLTSQVQRLQQSLQNANQDKLVTRQSSKAQTQQKQKEITRRYTANITQVQNKLQQKAQQLAYSKQTSLRYEKQLKKKNEELSELRNFANQSRKAPDSSNLDKLKSELQQLKLQLTNKQQTLQRKNQQILKLKRQKQYKAKHIAELEHELQESNSQLNKRRSETLSLKRQLNDQQVIQSQYQTLKSNYNKKIVQIVQFRQDLFEIQKLRMDNQSLRRDFQRSSAENKQKYKQIQKLKDQIYHLQGKLSSVKTTHPNNLTSGGLTNQNPGSSSRYVTNNSMDSQISQFRQLIKKKDNQISRLNQLLQDNQYTMESKARDLQIIKSQNSALIRSKQSEASNLNHNLSSVQSRLKQSQTKRSRLVDEINQLRIKFEDQLKSESQRHKSYYEKVIQRHEQDYRALKQKLRALEQLNNKQQIELEQSKTNQKKKEIQIRELNKKLLNQQSTILEKQQLFSTYRLKQTQSQQSVKALYDKLSAVQLQSKTKQQQLKLSEQKSEILQQKIKKNKRDHQNFRNKLIISQQYQNNNSVVDYLSKRIAQYESKMINQSQHDFGFRVKNSQANQVFENQVVYHLKIENQMLRKQLDGKGIEHDRKVLNLLQEQNAKRSKTLLKNSTFSSKIGSLSSQHLIKDNMQDIVFYKQKNKQLQERVEKHLKVNKQLKERIQALIKGSSQQKEVQRYRQQISELQHKISQYEMRIQALSEENRSMNKGHQKRQSRVKGHYEQRVKQLELKLAMSNKTTQQLTQQRTQLRINKSEISMQNNMLSGELNKLKQRLSDFTATNNQRYEEQVKISQSRAQTYQMEIAKLTNRCRLLQAQIQRLNEVNNSGKMTFGEINSLKQKLAQMSQQLRNSEDILHEEQLRSNALGSEVTSWQQKSRFLENEIQRLKQMNQLYAKKQFQRYQRQRNTLSESSVLKQSTSAIQIQLSSLQNQVSGLTSLKSENQDKIQTLNKQAKLYLQIQSSLHYYLQLIRSNVLQEEALLEEIVLGEENTASCIQAMKINIERSLSCLEQSGKLRIQHYLKQT